MGRSVNDWRSHLLIIFLYCNGPRTPFKLFRSLYAYTVTVKLSTAPFGSSEYKPAMGSYSSASGTCVLIGSLLGPPFARVSERFRI